MYRFILAIAIPIGFIILAFLAFPVIVFGRAERRIEIARGMTRGLSGIWDGDGDVTFSAWSWRMKLHGKKWGPIRVRVVDWLSSPGHCRRAWEWHTAHYLFDKANMREGLERVD